MKPAHLFLFLSLLIPFTASIASADDSPSQRLSFDPGWLFQKDDPPDTQGKLSYTTIKQWFTSCGNEFAKSTTRPSRPQGNLGEDVVYTHGDYDDTGWRKLNLPHDWGVEGEFKQEYPGETGKLPWWGVGWYRKHFVLPDEDRGKKIYLDFDGAMAYATVWLNGNFVGGWPYGYASWRVDLTPYVKIGGENVLAVRLDNPPDSSRWYPGGGIYRNVWLVKNSTVHVAHWGTYVTTPNVSPDSATIDAKVTCESDSIDRANVNVKTDIYEDDANGIIASPSLASLTVGAIDLAPNESKTVDAQIVLPQPKLWSPKSPSLYTAVTTITNASGKVLDTYQTVFGIRSIKFDPEQGFFINGEHLRIQGVCDHHDLGALGSAINVRALQRQLEILQEMGCNAIRTSHNPPSPELLDLCDRMGMVVMDECFDCWEHGKKPNDYHLLFPDWHEKDWRAQLRRDRNHPCVILWSIGNEIREQEGPDRQGISTELTQIAHDEDPTRPTTAACNQRQAGFNGFASTVDVFGYNYQWATYPRFHEANPTKALFGSETSSCVSTRGVYVFPVSDDKSKGLADFEVSSYDLYAPRWAWPPDAEFKAEDQNPNVCGEFVWTGFDYLGEPTPYGRASDPSRSSYFGIIDLAGFKKDRFYLYQAHWRPDFAMAHILPHWNWPDRIGQVTPVHVYTSGDEAELFLNGKSLGRKKKGQFEYRLRWDDVKYEPGELHVVAYKDGQQWAEDTVKTTGKAAKIALRPDRATIHADGQDLSYVTVSIADADGLMVPTADNLVKFQITGPGEIVGVDNGNPISFEPFKASQHKAFNGLCLVIVRSKAGQTGDITLSATSDGLENAQSIVTTDAAK